MKHIIFIFFSIIAFSASWADSFSENNIGSAQEEMTLAQDETRSALDTRVFAQDNAASAENTVTQSPSVSEKYQINIIVFRHTDSHTPLPDRVFKPISKAQWEQATAFMPLPHAVFPLKKELNQLARHSEFSVLFYSSGLQSADDHSSIRFQAGPLYENVLLAGEIYTLHELQALLDIQVDRYVVVHLDAQLLEPNADNTDQPYYFYRLMQTLQLRKGEIGYIDHPAFGVLVSVST